MKRSDTFILIGAVALVVLGVFVLYPQPSSEDIVSNTDEVVDTTSQSFFFEWTIKDLGESNVGIPKTELTLNVTGDMKKDFLVGTYDLMCAQQTIKGNEISAIQCWFAGGGVDIGVFKENGKYFVKQRDVDEGTAEGGGVIGEWKTVLEIK